MTATTTTTTTTTTSYTFSTSSFLLQGMQAPIISQTIYPSSSSSSCASSKKAPSSVVELFHSCGCSFASFFPPSAHLRNGQILWANTTDGDLSTMPDPADGEYHWAQTVVWVDEFLRRQHRMRKEQQPQQHKSVRMHKRRTLKGSKRMVVTLPTIAEVDEEDEEGEKGEEKEKKDVEAENNNETCHDVTLVKITGIPSQEPQA